MNNSDETKELDEVSIERAKKEFKSFLHKHGISCDLSEREVMQELVNKLPCEKCCNGKCTGHGTNLYE